jgi:hypothetical protein
MYSSNGAKKVVCVSLFESSRRSVFFLEYNSINNLVPAAEHRFLCLIKLLAVFFEFSWGKTLIKINNSLINLYYYILNYLTGSFEDIHVDMPDTEHVLCIREKLLNYSDQCVFFVGENCGGRGEAEGFIGFG